MRMRTLVAVLVLALAVSLSAAPKNEKERWRAGQVIVKYKAGFAPAADKHGVKSAKKVFGKFKLKGKAKQHADARGLDRVYLLELKKDDVEATVAALKNDPAVEYAEPNWTLSFDAVPNDPSYASQWGLAKIGAPAAWDTATSGTGVVIGVVDTGIDLTHPDLAANLWTNPGEIAGNNIDDDGNGFVDDVHGFNFANDTPTVTDSVGHGTMVAGIIGAAGNNATGGSGVVWSAKLAALKIGGATPDVEAAVQAIEYANMMGFRITSNSWGWSEGGQSFLLNDVVEAAEAAGYLFVAGAGNEAKNNDLFPTYPSHYTNPNVISVTATNSGDALSSYANYGFSSVDLAAPGDGIYSTTTGGGYASGNGTSYATPFVTGAAALYWTANPSLTAPAIREGLMLRSDPLPALNGITVSGGRLNVANLFDSDAVAPDAVTDLTVTDYTHRSVTVRFTASGDDSSTGRAARYDVRVSTSPVTSANFANATPLAGEPIPALPGTLETFKLSGIQPSTTYYVAVRVLDNAGNASLSNVTTFTTARAAVLFDDNVEGGARDWTVEGADGAGGPSLWHVGVVYGRTSRWVYGKAVQYGTNYDTGARNWGALTTRDLDLTQARDARLRFRQYVWMERNAGRDLAQVQVSVDGGAWTTLLAKQFTLYEDALEELDLSGYDGHHIRIRFFIDTVDGIDNAHPGWSLDDLVVDATSANAPPTASIDAIPAVTEDQAVTLSATASDPEGAALEYRWSFGDGTFAYTTQTSVTHTWTRPGNYGVTLVAYDRSNASDTATVSVVPVPVNDRPVAGIEVRADPPLYEETGYTIAWFNSSDEENDPLTCRFDYGDGTTDSSPCSGSWQHTWQSPGVYTITLIVNDGQLDSLPDTEQVTIVEKNNDKPVARTNGPLDAHPNESVTLDGSASSDEETSIASYLWTFPDGATATTATASKSFSSPGVKNVSLVVTDQSGLASTAASAQVRVCGGTNANLFTNTIYTCPGSGEVKLGINVTGGILPLTITWADGYTQQVTQLSGNYAERLVTPTATTNYALASVTDFLGCAGTVNTTPVPVVFASATLPNNNLQICPGQSTLLEPTLAGPGPWTLTWSDGYVQTIPVNGSRQRTVFPAETTVYSLTSATCAACASGTAASVSGTTTVTMNEPLAAVVSGGGTSCNGSNVPVTVTITGGAPPFTISWVGTNWSVTTSSRTHTSYWNPATTTTYTARVSSGSCAVDATGSATVTTWSGVAPKATALTGGSSICPGGATTLTATLQGDGPLTLTWTDGFVQTVEGSSATRTVSPATSTYYGITSIRNEAGCPGTVTSNYHYVSVTAPPTALVRGGGNICTSGSTRRVYVDLTGVGPYTITWADGVTETVPTSFWRDLAPATTTTYAITAVTDSRCSGTTSGSATINVSSLVTVQISGGGPSCPGAPATVTATMTGGTAPYTITWSDGFVQTVSGTVATREVSPASSTTYRVNAIQNTCGAVLGNGVSVYPAAVPTAAVSGGGTFCAGSSTTINAALTGLAPYTITWSDGFVQTVPSGSSATRTVSPSSSTVYTIASLRDARCTGGTSAGSATATLAAPVSAVVSGGGESCSAAPATILATISGEAWPFTLTWSDGFVQTVASGTTATRVVSPATPTTYTLTGITSGNGCSGTSSGSAIVTPAAPVSAVVSGGGESCPSAPATIVATISGEGLPFTVTWSDGFVQTVASGTTATRTVSPAAVTTYTVTSITSANGCSGTSSGNATVTPVPLSVTVTGGGSICPGGSATLTATISGNGLPFTLTWSDGFVQTVASGTAATRSVSPGATTTYSVTSLSNASGCTGTSGGTATVTVSAPPTALVRGGGTSCGSSVRVYVDLTGVGPFNVTWADGTSETVAGSFYRDLTPAQTTTYSLTSVSDSRCGGTVSGSATIVRTSSVSVTVSGGGASCPGSPATITATISGGTAPYTLTWSDGVTQQVSGTVATREITAATSTNYNVTAVSSSCGWTIGGSAHVYPAEIPTATVSGGGTFCEGSPATITASMTGLAPFTVTWSDGFVQTVSTSTATRQVTPSSSTVYTVASLRDARCTGGTSSGSATVTLSTPPTAVVSGGGASCSGAPATITAALTGTAPFTVTWSDGVVQTVNSGSTTTRTVSPASTTTYTVSSIRNANNCSGTSSGSATVTPSAPLTVAVSGGGATCSGGSATVNAAISGGGAPFTITWSDGFVQTASTNTATRSVSPGAATTYSVSSITNANGCTGTASGSATVTPSAAPTAVVRGGGASCSGGGAVVYVDLTGVGPFTITWTGGATETVTGSFYRVMAPATTTTYSISAVSDSRCSGTSSGSATVTPASAVSVTVSGGGASCPGSPATINATISGGTGPFTITWSDGVVQQVSGTVATRQVTVSSYTNYNVTAISPNQCGTTIGGVASVFPTTAPTIAVSGTGTFCEGTTTAITATLTGTAPFTVTWSDGVVQTVNSGTTATRNVSPVVTTTYTATVRDSYCSGTSSGSAVVTPTLKPVITTQPQSKTIAKRTATTLTVATTESGLSYQWYQGASGTTTTPVGTNSATLTTPKLTANTQYWVKIWKTACAAYPTHSATATVTVQ